MKDLIQKMNGLFNPSRDVSSPNQMRRSVTCDRAIDSTLNFRLEALSEGATTPEELRVNTMGQISKETERLLFKSNPELNGFTSQLVSSHQKREMRNIEMLERIDSINDSQKDGKEKSLKSRVIQRMKRQASKSSNEVVYDWASIEEDKLIYVWHLPNKNLAVLQDFTLFRPYSFIKGGQGSIHSVVDRLTNKKFVMKIKQKKDQSANSWHLQYREHVILQALNHPLIVSLHHVFCTKNTIILVMEHLVGGCLWKHVASKGLLPESLCVYYSGCVLLAIQYLHEHNIMFRDLKSANVVLDWYRRPKLVDLGMAKYISGHEPPELKNMIQNTEYSFAGYLAPEIYLSPASTGPKVDIWGLGYIILEIQLGYGVFFPPPWSAENRQHLRPEWRLKLSSRQINITEACHDLLKLLLQQDPVRRPSLAHIKSHIYYKDIQWQDLCMSFGPNIEAIEGVRPLNRQKNYNCEAKVHGRGSKRGTSSKKRYHRSLSPNSKFKSKQ